MEKYQRRDHSGREKAISTQPNPRRNLPRREALLETLERIGCGGVILDTDGNLIAANSVAIEIVKRRGSPETVGPLPNTVCLPLVEDDWVTSWQNTESPLAIVRIPTEQDTVLMMVDIGSGLQPSMKLLRQMFGVTPGESKESKATFEPALGSAQAAEKIGVSKTTTQLASVFANTQAELVAFLARLADLPGH